MMSELITFGKVKYNSIDVIKNTNIKEVETVLKNISFDNYTIYTVKPLKDKR